MVQNVGSVSFTTWSCGLQRTKCQTGISLTELMITLAIAIVLITVAVPIFNNFIQLTRLTNATNALRNAMNLARMEAIKRNGRVDLIARNGSWKNGWMVAVNNQPVFNQEALHGDIHIDSTFPDKINPSISYNSTGHTRSNTGRNSSLLGTIRLSMGEHVRLITINFLGRVRVCNPAADSEKFCRNQKKNLNEEDAEEDFN